MLDLSNNEFSSAKHFEELLITHKLSKVAFYNASYPVGWINLINELIISLKNYHFESIILDDSFGQLDIKFTLNAKRHELVIWKKIDDAKYESRKICMGCGERHIQLKVVNTKNRLCKSCHENAGESGRTGTWLDRY